MVVNASLGAVLWGAYGETSKMLQSSLGSHTLANSAISGAVAGASQALIAAPAENVKFLLEHGLGCHSWSFVWKEVFLKKNVQVPTSAGSTHFQDIRELRGWLQEVSSMASRGWNGWGWGFAKDTIGPHLACSVFSPFPGTHAAQVSPPFLPFLSYLVALDQLPRTSLLIGRALSISFRRMIPCGGSCQPSSMVPYL